MLSAWVRLNTVPDREKITRYRIGTLYIDPRSTNAADVIASLQQYGVTPGIYECPGWPEYENPNPAKFASIVSRHANALIPRQGSQASPLMLDLEGVSRDWIAETVTRYRRFQPRRPTSFTTEAYQWGDKVPLDACLKANLDYYVQNYTADMTPIDDPDWAVLAICRGYPASMVHTFYGYKRPPTRATDGCLFVLEEMP